MLRKRFFEALPCKAMLAVLAAVMLVICFAACDDGNGNGGGGGGGGGLPSASKLAEYGLEGFTLPDGVTLKGWDEYNNNQLYIDVDSATDPRPAIRTWLNANGWSGGGNYLTKSGGLTLSLNQESDTWYSIEVNK